MDIKLIICLFTASCSIALEAKLLATGLDLFTEDTDTWLPDGDLPISLEM